MENHGGAVIISSLEDRGQVRILGGIVSVGTRGPQDSKPLVGFHPSRQCLLGTSQGLVRNNPIPGIVFSLNCRHRGRQVLILRVHAAHDNPGNTRILAKDSLSHLIHGVTFCPAVICKGVQIPVRAGTAECRCSFRCSKLRQDQGHIEGCHGHRGSLPGNVDLNYVFICHSRPPVLGLQSS